MSNQISRIKNNASWRFLVLQKTVWAGIEISMKKKKNILKKLRMLLYEILTWWNAKRLLKSYLKDTTQMIQFIEGIINCHIALILLRVDKSQISNIAATCILYTCVSERQNIFHYQDTLSTIWCKNASGL